MAVAVKDKQALGKKLKLAREGAILSQRQAARALEISNAALSDIENGNNFPSEALLIKAVEKYNPTKKLKKTIYEMYAKAKDAPPPDISRFIKNNNFLCELLRELMEKDITAEGLEPLRIEIQKLEDKQHEPAEQSEY